MLRKAGLPARVSPISEPRGVDGLGKRSAGLDHGVFIPFREMFGLETDIPIVQVSIESSFDPGEEWKIGQILDELRCVQARDRAWCSSLIPLFAEDMREY